MRLRLMERRLQRAQLVYKAPQTPYVRFGVVRFFLHELGGHVVWRPDVGVRKARLWECFGQAKVAELDGMVLMQEYWNPQQITRVTRASLG